MKQIIDRIGYSFIGILILIIIEGVGTLGLAFQFEQYDLIGCIIQFILLYLAIWGANKIYDSGDNE
jgi:hypothetical protein